MKKKNFKIFSLLTFILFIGLLAGCSANKGDAEPSYPGYVEQTDPYSYGEEKESQSGLLINGNKIIYQIDLTFQSDDSKTLEREIRDKVTSLGGYVVKSTENSDINSTYYYGSGVYKVPTDKLNEFESYIDTKEELTYREKSSENVEGTYVTHQASLETLEAKLAIYQQMFDDNAGKSEEQLKILDRMDSIQLQIAQERKKLDIMDNQIDYSTIYVTYRNINSYNEPSVWSEYGTYLLAFGQALVLVLLYSLPFLAIAGVAVVIVVSIKKKKINKHQ